MAQAVISGMGCITPLGNGVKRFEQELFSGACGLSPITRFSTEGLRNDLAGEVRDLPSAPGWLKPSEPQDLGLLFLAAAVDEAISAAGLDPSSGRVGLVLSTNFAGSGALDAAYAADGRGRPSLDAVSYDAGVRLLVDGLGIHGPAVSLSISCASGTSAVHMASEWVKSGHVDAAIAAGYDALSLYLMSGLSILRTVSTDTCRPFDKDRSGTIFSEGAAAVVIEGERATRPLAEVLGGSDTNNAYHLTAPDKKGEGIELALRLALSSTEVGPQEIDYVNAHGTATVYHDVTEVRAAKQVLGDRAHQIPMSSIKGACGHLMGAAGALEIVASVLAIQRQEAPPTIGLNTPDPECDLDHVPGQAKAAKIETVLTNSAGIGGSNASLILRRAG